MRHRSLHLALSLAFGAFAGAVHATLFTASMDGLQENPPTGSPAVGYLTGSLTGGPGSWVFTYSYSYSGLTIGATAGHIHNAPVGVNGGVKHPLDIQPTGTSGGPFPGDWRFDDGTGPLSDFLASEMLIERTYVNIHTSNFPGGEIRGQLRVVPEPSTVVALLTGVGALFARRRKS